MPSKPRPKTFYAVVPCSVRGNRYNAGDPVEGIDLDVLMRYGSRFVSFRREPTPSDSPSEGTTEKSGDE